MQNAFPSRRLGFLLAWFLCCSSLFALPAFSQPALQTSHQAWSTEEGLPASGVHQIFQSRDGYLWLATEGGAVRFDGSAFTTFRHENQAAFLSNDIAAIAEDSAGNLWFGTSDGLVELHEGTFRRFGEQGGLPSSAVTSVAAPKDGSILVLTGSGLTRFDGDRFRSLPNIQGDVTTLETSPDGTVWLLSDTTAFHYVGAQAPLQPLPLASTEPLLGLQFGPGGTVWTRSARSVLETGKGFHRQITAGQELPSGRITALEVDRRGTAWIGTSHGLFSLQPAQGSRPLPVDTLRGESIASLLQDREGNLWVGTEGSGLHILRPRIFRSDPAASGEAVTTVLVASDGTPWFGTRNEGLHTIAPSGLQTPVAPALLTSSIILSLAQGAHGDIWAGTPDGLNHITGRSVEQFTAATGLPDDFVRSVLVDAQGVVWAGTRRGLARLDRGAITTVTTADGLGSDSIGPLIEVPCETNAARKSCPSELWVGTSSGISHLVGNRMESFASSQQTGGNIVTALASDGHAGLWVGMHEGGLSHFQDGKFKHLPLSALPSEIVAILLDRTGFLWLRGTRSIYRVSQDTLLSCAALESECDVAVAVYSTVDGMPSDALAGYGTPDAWQSGNGNLWFATRTGIAVANPSQFSFNIAPPPVVVERFRVDDVDVPLYSSKELRIEPGHNRYVFDFAALSYTAPSKNRYRYMLEGFDPTWIEAGSAHTASYTNLPARHYVFRVQAANNDGVWNRSGATLSFQVLPPIYRRWWFYLFVLLLVSGLALAIYRFRVHSIEQRFALVLNERNRVAREVHDTLAQDFVSVSLQLDLASNLLKANQLDAAGTQLQATRKLVKQGLEEARQSIWNLRANTAADSLPARLTALVKRYAEAEHPPRLKMGGAYHRVSSQIEDEVFRIAQESLSNIERHAQAEEAYVELHYEPNALRMTVRDNGRGFSSEAAEKLQGHYGLRGMRERAAALNATFTIQSEPGQGTTVTLLVALAEREGART